VLAPSHTIPVVGRDAITHELRTYRDGIQWVRDAVVRGANAGYTIDRIVSETGLPAHLVDEPALQELYGQVDWSARAIYGNELGWFDGRPETLYPMALDEQAGRTVHLMGGVPAVWDEVERAQSQGEHRWALHLIALVRLANEDIELPLDQAEAESLRALAEGIFNTNGRAYLIESALERTHDVPPPPTPTLNDEFIDAIPLSLLFEMMAIRLDPELSIDAHEAVVFQFSDTGETFIVTVRYGVAEVVAERELPGTPPALATVVVNAPTWRRVALGIRSPRDAMTSGAIEVDGSVPDFLRFVRRFRRGI
jgi:alkyl sulfatase BDS1-like metallo-beta-lactamase superfamily hydrolase